MTRHTPEEINAANERVIARSKLDRGDPRRVGKLYPQEWEAAQAEELGVSVEDWRAEIDLLDAELRAAADERLARGERALHDARVRAAEGKL